ncbi:TraR/DksA C4-type zinc finger protein [Photorhabdus sp. RM71S]|uniref:TraR/DksA C4-type zinc finger protein n=1 Tax=Photorhabdus sp. RM71S TaxID=3342824 RepID=UPI0036DE1AAE
MSDDIDDTTAQAVTAMWLEERIAAVRREMHTGRVSLKYCEGCGNRIDEQRRQILSEVRLCVGCQEVAEHWEQVRRIIGGRRG